MRVYLIILSLFFTSPAFTQSSKTKNPRGATINEVVQLVFKMEQQKMVDAINMGLKDNEIGKGRFFVGEVKESDKILGKAGLKKFPQVYTIENGFAFKIRGEEYKIEFTDFLTGKVSLNGEKINLNGKMSYSSLQRAVIKTLKKLDDKKTSFSPTNLLINKAHALWPLLAVGAAVGLGAAYVIDKSFSYLGYAINSDDKHNQKKFNNEMEELKNKCEADYRSLTNGNTSVHKISSVKAVSQLGENLEKIAEELQDDDTIHLCKDLARFRKVEFESVFFKIDYDSLIAKGCTALNEVHRCLLKTRDYMKDEDIEINESYHELDSSDSFSPYVETMKSSIGK